MNISFVILCFTGEVYIACKMNHNWGSWIHDTY